MYAMLTASLPFENQQEALESFKNGQNHCVIDYISLNLDAIEASDVCKDLMSRMLIKDPKARLTIEQVLAHPFFADTE